MAKPHLYLHTPEAVFKARVNMASVTYPVSQITFDTVTLGTSGVLEFGMTMLLGTSEGADDLGRQRIRDVVVGSDIQIPFTSQGVEDGQLDVQDNAYITVLLDFRLWAKIPTFDVENAQDKKDGWISVGNKLTTEIPPVANAGPGFADYIDPTTGVITVEFPDGGINTSFTVGDGDTIVGHTWDVRDGTITVGSSSDETITATFPAGFRYVVHTVESSNGSTHTTRVPILAVDPDDDPTLRVYQASQRLEQTGQTLDITIYEDAPRATYPDGTLVMFWMDEPADPGDRSHMKFIGFVDNEDATVNRNQKGLVRETKLHCVDVAGRLRQLPGFPQALSRVEDESPWSYYPSLDMAKSLHYLLHWHCTALEIADFTIPSELLDYDAMRLDAGGASLFEQVNQQAGKAVPDYILTCNSLGQLVVTKDWRLVDTGDRPAASPIITEDNWTDLNYSYNRHPKVHVLRSAAIEASTSFVDVDGVETLPLVFSIAPSNASAFGQGLSEHTENEGLALSQEDLNEAEGHRFAMLNARYGEFSFTDPTGEDFWEYEPALMQRVQLNIGATYAAQRGLDFTTANGMIKSITVNYNTSNRGTAIKVQVSWEKETSGYPAITYVPEETGETVYTVPQPNVPGVPEGQNQVAVVIGNSNTRGGMIKRTSNFLSAAPNWTNVSLSGLATNDTVWSFVVDPFSPGYRGTPSGVINGWIATETALYRVEDIFGTLSMSTEHTFANTISVATPEATRTVAASFGRFQSVEENNPWVMCASYYASSLGLTVVYSTDGGATWSGEITVTANNNNNSNHIRRNQIGLYLSPKTPGLAYLFAYETDGTTAVSGGYVTTDWGATWSPATAVDLDGGREVGGSLHFPWPDNNNEQIAYHGYVEYLTSPSRVNYKTHKVEGTTVTDISPQSGGITFAPMFGLFGLRTHDNNRSYVAMAGRGNGVDSGNTDKYAAFVSNDDGGTWTEIVAPITYDGGSLLGVRYPQQVAFAAENPSVLYVWGMNWLDYSTDFGASLQDKRNTTFGDYANIVGLCGGPTS